MLSIRITFGGLRTFFRVKYTDTVGDETLRYSQRVQSDRLCTSAFKSSQVKPSQVNSNWETTTLKVVQIHVPSTEGTLHNTFEVSLIPKCILPFEWMSFRLIRMTKFFFKFTLKKFSFFILSLKHFILTQKLLNTSNDLTDQKDYCDLWPMLWCNLVAIFSVVDNIFVVSH